MQIVNFLLYRKHKVSITEHSRLLLCKRLTIIFYGNVIKHKGIYAAYGQNALHVVYSAV